jgi:hypothetical protein
MLRHDRGPWRFDQWVSLPAERQSVLKCAVMHVASSWRVLLRTWRDLKSGNTIDSWSMLHMESNKLQERSIFAFPCLSCKHRLRSGLCKAIAALYCLLAHTVDLRDPLHARLRSGLDILSLCWDFAIFAMTYAMTARTNAMTTMTCSMSAFCSTPSRTVILQFLQ